MDSRSSEEANASDIYVVMPAHLHASYRDLTLSGIHERLLKRIQGMPLKYQGQVTVLVEAVAEAAEASKEGQQLQREAADR